MFKKFSYLFAASLIFCLSVLANTHAMDVDDLVKEIDRFVTRSKQPKVIETVIPEGYGAYLGYVTKGVSYVSQGTGTCIRFLGEKVRKNINKTCGNGMRWFGEFLVEEEPSLERTTRDFWLAREQKDSEVVLTSTSCALFLSPVLTAGLNDISAGNRVISEYNQFIKTWNNSSFATPSENEDKNKQYLLNGIIRGLVKQNVNVKSFQDISLLLLNHELRLHSLFFTRHIDDASVSITNRKREETFMEYFRLRYAIEQNALLREKEPSNKINLSPIDISPVSL